MMAKISQVIEDPDRLELIVKDIINHYEEMETIIDSLKMKTSELIIDENPNDDDADRYSVDPEYIELFINTLENKMTEIRNILNYH